VTALYTYLPAISHHFPGITPLNVYDLTLDWWRVYVAQVKAIADTAEKQAKSR
jgi:hypothetical protein